MKKEIKSRPGHFNSTTISDGKTIAAKRKLRLMRTLCIVVCVSSIGLNVAHAQLWKKIKDKVKTTVEHNVVDKSGAATTGAMNSAEKSVMGDKAVEKEANTTGAISGADGTAVAATTTSKSTAFKNYDFVPGDKIIFEPDLSKEADAELPARFTLNKGNGEIQSFEGGKILHLDQGGRISMSPSMSSEAYLPTQFTVELDMLYENDDSYFRYSNNFKVEFRKAEDMDFSNEGLYALSLITNTQAKWGVLGKTEMLNLTGDLKKAMNTANIWHHIAIYVRGKIGKVYIDGYRIAAINNLPTGAGKLSIATDGRYGFKVKNFRLAAGGDDKYQKIVTDGKFITHGILFDVNKAVIKPESTGALNEIVQLMQDHKGLNFEIDGHTDSDGDAAANQQLSQERATAVKEQLVKLGVNAQRLTTKGFGETKPIDKNDSPEGKANNRRVEFVKI